MSRKKAYCLILIILVLSIGCALFFPNFMTARGVVYAENSITDSVVGDLALYKKLQAAKREISGSSYLHDQCFSETTELDLSNSDKNNAIPDDTNRISDISSLRKFNLSKLQKLILKNNSLTTIDGDVFEGMQNLEYLDVSNNQITSIDLSYLPKLKVLIINNNQLSSLDVSQMVTTGYEDGSSVLNISHNNFSSIAEIQLPAVLATSNFEIVGYNNNITDVVNPNGNFHYVLGLQGVAKTEIEKNEVIKYYNTGDETLTARVYKLGKDENDVQTKTLVLTLEDSTTTITPLNLAVGEYAVEYYKDDVKIDESNKYTLGYVWFEDAQFSLIPSSPSYVYKVGDKEYDDVEKLTKKAKLLLTADEGATIYYSFDLDKWYEGSEVELNNGGNYYVHFKSVVDGVESHVSGVYVNSSINLKIPDIFLVLLMCMVGALFVVGVYFIGKFLQRR